MDGPPGEVPRRAAVAAVFDGALDLLLIGRAKHPSDPWSGHIAFPGGRVEPHDAHPLAAAIRETEEEVGLRLDPARCLGPLDEVPTIGATPGLIVHPFVFLLQDERPALTTNREVATVHWRPLESLLADVGRTTMLWSRGPHSVTLPCVVFDEQRLWGLTLQMVDDLLHRLDGRGQGLARIRPPPGGASA